MALNSLESLTIGLYDGGAIGYANSIDSELVGKPGGLVKLKSGRLSPTYVNLRGLTSYTAKQPVEQQRNLRYKVINAYNEVIDERSQQYEHILGIPHAMTALGAMIGLTRGESVLSMRTEAKQHGISKMIEGNYISGDIVLGLDDVVTDGASKIETVDKVNIEELEMDEFVVLIDRQEGGVSALNEAGLKVYSTLTMGGITAMLKANNKINDYQVYWTTKYFKDLVDEKIIDQMPPELAGMV